MTKVVLKTITLNGKTEIENTAGKFVMIETISKIRELNNAYLLVYVNHNGEPDKKPIVVKGVRYFYGTGWLCQNGNMVVELKSRKRLHGIKIQYSIIDYSNQERKK